MRQLFPFDWNWRNIISVYGTENYSIDILWKPCVPSVKSPQFPSLGIVFLWDLDSDIRTCQRSQQNEPLFGLLNVLNLWWETKEPITKRFQTTDSRFPISRLSAAKNTCYLHMWSDHRCNGYMLNRAFPSKKKLTEKVSRFTGFYIMNRTLHTMATWRYEISLLVLKNISQHSKRKFRISARPCYILYLLSRLISY